MREHGVIIRQANRIRTEIVQDARSYAHPKVLITFPRDVGQRPASIKRHWEAKEPHSENEEYFTRVIWAGATAILADDGGEFTGESELLMKRHLSAILLALSFVAIAHAADKPIDADYVLEKATIYD